jgi:hypothetical protein
MERKIRKIGEKVPKVLVLQNDTYIEYCAMEHCGGKIQFMI